MNSITRRGGRQIVQRCLPWLEADTSNDQKPTLRQNPVFLQAVTAVKMSEGL